MTDEQIKKQPNKLSLYFLKKSGSDFLDLRGHFKVVVLLVSNFAHRSRTSPHSVLLFPTCVATRCLPCLWQ